MLLILLLNLARYVRAIASLVVKQKAVFITVSLRTLLILMASLIKYVKMKNLLK